MGATQSSSESEVAKDFAEVAEAAEGPSVRKRKSFSIDQSLLPEELTSKYEVIDKIGTGSFGAVYKIRDRKTRSMRAAKYVESKENTVAEVRLVTVTSLKPHCPEYSDIVMSQARHYSAERSVDCWLKFDCPGYWLALSFEHAFFLHAWLTIII